MNGSVSSRKLALVLVLVVSLAACTREPVQECEPGVSEISNMGAATGPKC